MGIELKLRDGDITLVDEEDFAELSKWRWYSRNGYVLRVMLSSEEGYHRGRKVSMHRVIMNCPNGFEVDHIDGNGLNNRRENLRVVTHLQNAANKRSNANTSSKYRGVNWCKKDKRWRAQIMYKYVPYHLGNFESEVDAALAYDTKAREFWKEFGRYNFPLPGEHSALRET